MGAKVDGDRAGNKVLSRREVDDSVLGGGAVALGAATFAVVDSFLNGGGSVLEEAISKEGSELLSSTLGLQTLVPVLSAP